MEQKEYALYKGEELLAMGTKKKSLNNSEFLLVQSITIILRLMPNVQAKRKEGDWWIYEIQSGRILRQYGRQ